jgi:large subunit ribosomal protein L28
MARRCDICGKGTTTGHKVSHSNNRTKRVWKANIQRIKVMEGPTKKKIRICTGCLKTGKVEKVY